MFTDINIKPFAGFIQKIRAAAFLFGNQGNQVCSKQLYRKVLHHKYDEPKHWLKGWERILDSGNEAGFLKLTEEEA